MACEPQGEAEDFAVSSGCLAKDVEIWGTAQIPHLKCEMWGTLILGGRDGTPANSFHSQ